MEVRGCCGPSKSLLASVGGDLVVEGAQHLRDRHLFSDLREPLHGKGRDLSCTHVRYSSASLNRQQVPREVTTCSQCCDVALRYSGPSAKARYTLNEEGRNVMWSNYGDLQPGSDPRAIHREDHVAGA